MPLPKLADHQLATLRELLDSELLDSILVQNTGLNDGDIGSSAFIVLMEATKDMDQDLKQFMAEVKSVTAAKQKMRDLISRVSRDVATSTASELQGKGVEFAHGGLGGERAYHRVPLPVPDSEAPGGVQIVLVDPSDGRTATLDDLQAFRDDLNRRLDSLIEMGETSAVMLQTAMACRSRMLELLSNVMKTWFSTQEKVIQNLK